MKELLATRLSWVAFLSALMIVTVPIYLIVCSKCDMFERKSLYYLVTNKYLDFLATLPGDGLSLFFGLAPSIWPLLFVWPKSVRIVPWERRRN